MNREIKFRAWNKKGKVMGVVDEIYFSSKTLFFTKFDRSKIQGGRLHIPFYVNFEECILMQYTGLKDKNDKEIYESDIMSNSFNDIKYLVSFSKKTGSWKIESKREVAQLWGYNSLEIIGNIYETHELLG